MHLTSDILCVIGTGLVLAGPVWSQIVGGTLIGASLLLQALTTRVKASGWIAGLIALTQIAPRLEIPWHVGLAVGVLVLTTTSQVARADIRRWFSAKVTRGEVAFYVSLTLLVCLVLVVMDRLNQRFFIMPSISVLWLVGGALVNSIAEEVTWRGFFLLSTVENGLGFRYANLVQGLAFGVAHWTGFPSGVIGVLLAVVFGLAMGVVVRRSKGLLVPIAIHFCADVVAIRLLTS